MTKAAMLVLLLAACEPMMDAVAIPEAHTSLDSRSAVYLLGSSRWISASWEATCHRSDSLLKMSKKDSNWTVSCKQKPIALEVHCSRPCRVDANDTERDEPGHARASVTFLTLGPMRLRTITRRLDNGHTDDDTSGPITIVLPDRLELGCATDSATVEPCSSGAIRANDPRIFPRAILDGRAETSTLLLVNGAPRARYEFGVSLATLFPGSAHGSGVEPGVYDVELALGSVHQRWTIVAR